MTNHDSSEAQAHRAPTLTDFLLARIAEDEDAATMYRGDEWHIEGDSWRLDESRPMLVGGGKILASFPGDEEPQALGHVVRWSPARVLAECEAKRRIVELHRDWPVLVERPVEVEPITSTDPSRFAFRASQQIMWMTEREYRDRFGDEPPTAPMLRALASVYADHPAFDPEWRL